MLLEKNKANNNLGKASPSAACDFARFECNKHRLIAHVRAVALCSIWGCRVNGSAPSLHPARGQFPATPSFSPPHALPPNSRLCHAEINYFMSPNMQIILLNERCLTSQIQLICKCKWGFICDILYGWQKTKRLLNSNTNCSDWLSHIIIQYESSKYQNSD